MAATAGLMIYISSDELIPAAFEVKDHTSIFALMAGVVFVILLSGI
jgi:zinc transporter ZupT